MKLKRLLLWFLGAVACVLLFLVLPFAFWLRPFSASQTALNAMQSGNGVTVSTKDDQITFTPATTPTTGLIFYPGARVDPASYAVYMRAFAEHGYLAVIVEMPLNMALLGGDRASDVLAAHPTISNWVIGGHSLGGVMALQYAAKTPQMKALLLYGAYPDSDYSHSKNLVVTSIYGSNDALATPEKITASKGMLPDTTRFIQIQGSIHGYFGDYGEQDGDGQPSVSRQQAQAEIISASLQLLQQVSTKAFSPGV
jgi:Alpha/beta hydrolase family